MRSQYWILTAALWLILGSTVGALAQSPAPIPDPTQILDNSDVLRMVKSGMKENAIITTILTSRCSFDVFPPVLQDLRRRGVPNGVLLTMTLVPSGPAGIQLQKNSGAESAHQSAKVKLLRGMGILVETLYPVSSADVKEGSTISFAVVYPVYVDGVLTVARGAVAKARVIRVKKAQSWGRGGALTWQMEHITAVDGTRIPVRLSQASAGGNRAGQLAAGAAVTSALVFPYTAPAALVWGFKKGDDAILRGSKQFSAILSGDTEVVGLVPDKDRPIFHYGETLKAKVSATSAPTAFPRLGIRN